MSAETFLEKLDGVLDRGNGQWLARCPAHDDKSPSLSIKEAADGTLLIHCFACCSPADVVAAVGLDLSDLFPAIENSRKGERPRWNAKDLLLIIRDEATLVGCVAGRMSEGKSIPGDDLCRVQKAVRRIHRALGVASVR